MFIINVLIMLANDPSSSDILCLISKVHISSYCITVESLLYFSAIAKADGNNLQDTKWIVPVILKRLL